MVRSCFDRHLGPYKGCVANPFAWDDVCVSSAGLPRRPEDAGHHRLKALGIYFFDFVKHHRTVWGEDLTRQMPEPVDPRPLIPDRLEFLIAAAEKVRDEGYVEWARLGLVAGGAVVALQVYFSQEPSLHKAEVTRRYGQAVPDFPEKPFGLAVWNNYLHGPVMQEKLPRPFEDYHALLAAAKRLVEAAR